MCATPVLRGAAEAKTSAHGGAANIPREEHQPGSDDSMRQDLADSAKANTLHRLRRHGAPCPQAIPRLSATINVSTKPGTNQYH